MMTRRSFRSGIVLMLWLGLFQPLPADTLAPPPSLDAVRLEFMAAMQRVRDHLPDQPDTAALDAYVLHDYLTAARLRRDLATDASDALDTQIDAFLKAHAAQPVTRGLRHEWLMSLASRKKWDWFLARSIGTTDSQLACDRLSGRLAGDSGTNASAHNSLVQDALARWSLPQKPPAECAAVFDWLRSLGALTPALAEARTRAALAADNPRLAQDFVVGVPEPRASALLQWISLLETPKAALMTLANTPAMPVEADALAAGFNRLSFTDYGAASALLASLVTRPGMTPALRAKLQRSAALGAAYSRSPDAVALFTTLGDTNDPQVEEWRIRAALWAGDFSAALKWTDALPSSLASLPRWRYWRARAVEQLSGEVTAAPLYAGVAGLRDYYGYLAADRLEQPYQLNIHPSPDEPEVTAALLAEPGMQRAHALYDCEMTDEATSEWNAVVGNENVGIRIQAAHLAFQWGWYAETIATLAQAGEWDDVPLRYPRPYAALVADASKQSAVPADWIFAVMRQESLFRRDAVSRADARGLMQMQPATAVAVARRWHLAPPTHQGLFDPAVAIPLGAVYLRELLDKYNGQLDQTLAAYNAGPMPVARWMPGHTLDADIWIENIPYAETRSYIQHVVEHIVAFATMRDAVPPRLSMLLPPLSVQINAP